MKTFNASLPIGCTPQTLNVCEVFRVFHEKKTEGKTKTLTTTGEYNKRYIEEENFEEMMMKKLFSRPEVSFTRDGIAQNLRSDGRDNAQSRATDIVSLGNHRASLGERKKRRDAMNAITRAVGHARVRMGRTEVVCAISGRIASSDDEEEDKEDEEEDALLLFTIGQKRKEKDDKATTTPGGLSTSIEVYVETMSTRNIGGTSTSFGQQQQVLFNETDKYCGGLKRALEFAYGSVDLNDANGGGGLRKSLEINGGSRSHDSTRRSHWRHRWKLRMDFLVLSDDGNVLDALAIAGKCALFDARLPRVRVKRRGEEEEVELMSDSEEDDGGEEERKESNSSSNTTLDISDVPLIATATYFGKARQPREGGATTTIKIDDEEFLPTIAIDCVASEETCGDFALAVSVTRDGAVTSVQRVDGAGDSNAMAVESDVSDNVIKFARKHCVKVHKEVDSYLSTLVLRDEDDEEEDSLGSSESEDEEMQEADQDEFR